MCVCVCVCMCHHHHHHHVALTAWSSLTLSRHPSIASIAPGMHPVSVQS